MHPGRCLVSAGKNEFNIIENLSGSLVTSMMEALQKNSRCLLICFMLLLVTLLTYRQVMDHEFINYDDGEYVAENPQVQAGLTAQGGKWAFTTFHAGNWHPLTWLSHMLDCQLFGLKPAGHHGMNLFLHIASTLLLFLVFHRMTKALYQSAFVAALFALHPLHVESVAWVAERKDVLSACFWMLTMGAYAYYAERPDIRRYLPVLLFFVLGLLAKPMLVTLPFVLLLMDYWPLGRLQPLKPLAPVPIPASAKNPPPKKKKGAKNHPQDAAPATKAVAPYQWSLIRFLVWEKIPLFILSAISCVITFSAQQKGGAVALLELLPLSARLGNVLLSYVGYIGKMIWPVNLAVFYPYPFWKQLWPFFGAALILVLITILVIKEAKRFPYLAVGWFWFTGTLVPVIGLVQVGMQAMADRYTYIPIVGLFIMAAWGAPELLKKWQHGKTLLTATAVIILLACTIVTYRQLPHWQDSIALFRHALSVTKDNDTAHNNLGTALRKQGNIEEAIGHYRAVIRINQNDGQAHNNLGNALFMQGQNREAEFHLREALRINPKDAKACYNLGVVMSSQNRTEDAISLLREAISINPDLIEAHFNLGDILAKQGIITEALTHFAAVIRLNPNDEKAYNNMGRALLAQGRIEEAIAYFQSALRIQPELKLAQDNLNEALRLQTLKK
jgi:Flp pilus assembly protein TadD